MDDKKGYFEYLNELKSECERWAGGDKDWSIAIFDKMATPFYYRINDQFRAPQPPLDEPPVKPTVLQPQIIQKPVSEKHYTSTRCIQCDRPLTEKEVTYCNNNNLSNICYHCNKGIKRKPE